MKMKITALIAVVGIGSVILLSACTNKPATNAMNDMSTAAMQVSNESTMSGEMNDEMDGDMMESDGMIKNDDMMKDDSIKSDMSESTLLSDYVGKKTYVKFWASWCSICLSGLEDLDRLAAQDKDFEVVTVVNPSVRGEKSKEEFTEWFDSLGYENIKVILDDGSLTKKYGIAAFPTSVYLNSDGTDAKVSIGHSDNKTIQETMNMLQ